MTQNPLTEEQAKDLFVRQLKELSRTGVDPDSQARLANIFKKSEAACREQEAGLAMNEKSQIRSAPPLR